MDNLNIGHGKIVYKYLGFLVDEYKMKCCFQKLSGITGVEEPTYIYSFYNGCGCFSVLEVAQRNEWDCYIAESFDNDPCLLLDRKIEQKTYINRSVYLSRTFLSLTAESIRIQIQNSGCFWGVPLV